MSSYNHTLFAADSDRMKFRQVLAAVPCRFSLLHRTVTSSFSRTPYASPCCIYCFPVRCFPVRRMNILFAMGIPTTTDDSGYVLWLAHSWSVFVPPILALCAGLSFWVIRKIRHSSSAPPCPPGQTIAPFQESNRADSDPESPMHWSLPQQAVA